MEKDKRYRRIGWLTAILTNVFMLILFYFLVAWKEPFPPIPSYGIELSFGDTQTGQGEVTPSAPEPAETTEDSEPVEIPDEVEETTTETTEEVTEEPEEPISEAPSPDVVEEKPKEAPAKEPVKPVEGVTEEKKPESKPAEPPTISETPSPSQGETDEPGDAGKPEGQIEDRAIYGSQGGGENGASLQMTGWKWDFKPNPNDKSAETGKIVYNITIDDEGYVIKIELESSTVSPSVERLYRQSVERLSFSKTGDYKPAPTSTGKITFLIQTK